MELSYDPPSLVFQLTSSNYSILSVKDPLILTKSDK